MRIIWEELLERLWGRFQPAEGFSPTVQAQMKLEKRTEVRSRLKPAPRLIINVCAALH
jgi:hypothetical protein